MYAYELLARLRLLTLCGQGDDGELEWIGNSNEWGLLSIEEESIIRDEEVINLF